ncbi:MAG: SUMF1/EgtB/PvdO family nonheme iron enzyme [Myxococcota bacterium]
MISAKQIYRAVLDNLSYNLLGDSSKEQLTVDVLRGGSWINNAQNVRSAYRNNNDPTKRNNNIGFRCALAHRQTGWSVTEQNCLHAVFDCKTHCPPLCE